MKFGLNGNDVRRIVDEELGQDHGYDVDGLVKWLDKKKAKDIEQSKQKYWYADILFWLGLVLMLGGIFGGLAIMIHTDWLVFGRCFMVISLVVGIGFFAWGFTKGIGSEIGLYGDDDSGY